MKHARDDYNRIQDPAGKIPMDEPVFLLRGQDMLACRAVSYYASLCELEQAPEVAAKARAHADAMAAWLPKKIPDLPDPAAAPQAQPAPAEPEIENPWVSSERDRLLHDFRAGLDAAIDALASLCEASAEPVAFARPDEIADELRNGHHFAAWPPNHRPRSTVTPLYSGPARPREPLTDERVDELVRECIGHDVIESMRRLVRLTERAHSIREPSHDKAL